jgi:hypothetical protein
MNTVIDIPRSASPEGNRSFPAVELPAGVQTIIIRVQRCTSADPDVWDSEEVSVKARFEVSYDGGETYPFEQWVKGEGGIIVLKGKEVPEMRVSHDGFDNPPTHVRADLEVTGGLAITVGRVEAG